MIAERPVEIPSAIGCAGCGKPVNCLDSFGLTVPIDTKVPPSDFCCLACLARWAAEQSSEGNA